MQNKLVGIIENVYVLLQPCQASSTEEHVHYPLPAAFAEDVTVALGFIDLNPALWRRVEIGIGRDDLLAAMGTAMSERRTFFLGCHYIGLDWPRRSRRYCSCYTFSTPV